MTGPSAPPPERLCAARPGRSGSRRAGTVSTAVLAATLSLLAACDGGGARLSVIGRDGVERRATLDRPTSPAPGGRPLLIILHAGLFSGSLTRDELEPLPAVARDAGIALAFPDAEGLFWNDGSFSRALPRSLSAEADDLGFLDTLIAALVADGTADPAAIHIAGVSNGGMMAMRYACARADRVASVAVFLATLPLGAERECRPARPLHVLVVAGTADPVVRWTGEVALGGFGTLQRRMSVPETFEFWRRANRCGGELAPARALPRRGSGPDVLVHAASGCAGGVSTMLYEVRGGGHRLSAGDNWTLLRLLGRASPDMDPGAVLLRFVLEAGRRPGTGAGGTPPLAGPGARAAVAGRHPR
jgi:polyhydroxybutyrate depolymerase